LARAKATFATGSRLPLASTIWQVGVGLLADGQRYALSWTFTTVPFSTTQVGRFTLIAFESGACST